MIAYAQSTVVLAEVIGSSDITSALANCRVCQGIFTFLGMRLAGKFGPFSSLCNYL
jgi:hypothetical protein